MTDPYPTPATGTKPYKAVLAFVLAFLSALLVTIQGRPELDGMTALDWVIVFGSAFVTAGAVWAVPNPPQ